MPMQNRFLNRAAELALMAVLSEEPLPASTIRKRIERATRGAVTFGEASVWPLLRSLDKQGTSRPVERLSADGRGSATARRPTGETVPASCAPNGPARYALSIACPTPHERVPARHGRKRGGALSGNPCTSPCDIHPFIGLRGTNAGPGMGGTAGQGDGRRRGGGDGARVGGPLGADEGTIAPRTMESPASVSPLPVGIGRGRDLPGIRLALGLMTMHLTISVCTSRLGRG